MGVNKGFVLSCGSASLHLNLLPQAVFSAMIALNSLLKLFIQHPAKMRQELF